MAERDDVGEAIIHVREYRGDDPVALEYWARMLGAEVARATGDPRLGEHQPVNKEKRSS